MNQLPPLNLCTFEVATHLGRQRRLGAYIDEHIIDLNFATAWYMAQTGEAEPQQLSDALVPANLGDFLRSGLRATHTAEDLISGAGPNPEYWWRLADPPRGPNDETLVYRPEEVRILAPLPGRNIVGPEAEVRATECRPGIAAVIGACGLAGFTLLNDFGNVRAMGPYIPRPGDLAPELNAPPKLELTVRVNGAPQGNHAFNGAGRYTGDAGEAVAIASEILLKLSPGDVVELEIPKIGVLRNIVAPVLR